MITTSTLSEQFDVWYQSEPGRTLLEAEKRAIDKALNSLFGYFLVQIGGANIVDFLKSSSILHKVRLDHQISARFKGSQVQMSNMDLPLLHKSVDVIVLPHVLEFVDHPEKLLSACYDALIPSGRIIILSFNSKSLWGMARQWRKNLPELNTFLRVNKIKKQLSRLGLITEREQIIFYRPPFSSKKALERSMFLEAIGPLCWTMYGAISIIVAQKVKSTATMLQAPLFKEAKTKVKAATPEPTSRVSEFK